MDVTEQGRLGGHSLERQSEGPVDKEGQEAVYSLYSLHSLCTWNHIEDCFWKMPISRTRFPEIVVRRGCSPPRPSGPTGYLRTYGDMSPCYNSPTNATSPTSPTSHVRIEGVRLIDYAVGRPWVRLGRREGGTRKSVGRGW